MVFHIMPQALPFSVLFFQHFIRGNLGQVLCAFLLLHIQFIHSENKNSCGKGAQQGKDADFPIGRKLAVI